MLLAVVVSILMAGVRTAMVDGERFKSPWIVAAVVFGAVVGALGGLIADPPEGRGCVGSLVRAFGGALLVALAGFLLASPLALLVALVGAVILILYAACLRRFDTGPPQDD